MLESRDVRARFGSIEALRGVSLSVADGEIVSLIGANGAGKSTVLNVISGIVPATGTVEFKGASISELRASEVVRRGIVQVPEGRQVFSDLTVLENFEMGAYTQAPSQFDRDVSQIFALFPRLLERRSQLAGLLSGGEQQMLAIGRALMANPRLLLLDEPSMGLAPLVIASIFKVLSRLRAEHGCTILLVEQNAKPALRVSDRACFLASGLITRTGTAQELLSSQEVQEHYLGKTAGS